MLDIKFVIENPNAVKKDLQKRGDSEKIKWLDEIIDNTSQIKEIRAEEELLRKKRNEISKSINSAKKEGKDAKKFIDEAAQIPKEIARKDETLKEIEDRNRYLLMRIPNILHESVPVGKDSSENVEVRKWGSIKKPGFELKPHGELAEELRIADFKTATMVSGSGFVYVKGALALLDLSLQRFAIDHLIKKGFTLIEPPLMVGREAYEGVTSLDDFQNVMYKIDGEDMYLIATSEHPIVAMHKDSVIDEKELPLRYVGVSPCFRREIGSHGVDTRGFFRMHQFNKVEQVVFCLPEDSWKIHEEIQHNTEELLQALEIPYHVVNICTGDIGIVAAKKYDIEAWFPREGKYAEVTSCSNCTSYQAVRSNIKYRKADGTKEYLHTLNNTGLATSRIIRAILENYQNEDGSITVPKVLLPYMNGITKIGPKKLN
ncbi:MAG: serine--tRNA ligase [Candidatus Woesearchaeota archaeon]|nr:serine--tRNA ligase [Candidatus Woesearchaeota archaeon]